MSTASTARALPVEHPRPTEPRRRLEAVPAPTTRRPRLGYALMAMAGAALIAGTQIGLTIATTQDSFVLADLSSQQRELTLQTQVLHEQLAGRTSPQALAQKAADAGMVVAGSASYLSLSTGEITGAGTNAGWFSNIDPHGPGSVANSLLQRPVVPPPVAEDGSAGTDQADLPPVLAEGLPIPTTR